MFREENDLTLEPCRRMLQSGKNLWTEDQTKGKITIVRNTGKKHTTFSTAAHGDCL